MKKIALTVLFALCTSFTFNEDIISKISLQLEQYAKLNPDENLCLLLNQEKYTLNDTVFFSAYYYQSDLKPIENKRVFSVGLFSSLGKEINRINFSVAKGYTYNQIIVPANGGTGIMTLAAFDPQNGKVFFSRSISIVNRKSLEVVENTNESTQFGFEGGAFTLNAKNNLLVYTQPNKTVTLKSSSRELAKISSDSAGFASFEVVPTNGEIYSFNTNGTDVSLPAPTELGCGIHVSSLDNKKKIEISVPPKLQKGGDRAYLLLAHNRKIFATSAVVSNADGSFTYSVEDQDLPNGITEIVVITEGKVLAQRSLYHVRTKINAQLKMDVKVSQQRGTIPISFVLRDNAGNPLQGTFTVTAALSDAMQGYHKPSAYDDFFINPVIADFAHRMLKSTSGKKKFINDVMALKSSCHTPWHEIVANKAETPSTITNNLMFKGHFENTSREIPDSTLFTCFLQNSMLGYEARTRKGNVRVPFLYDFYGKEEMFYSLEDRGKDVSNNFKLISDTLSISIPSKMTVRESDGLDPYGDLAFKIQLVTESYGFFAAKKNKSEKVVNLNERFEDEAMGADLSVNVDDYVVFPAMEDLVKEVIPFLEVRTKKGEPTVKLLIKQKNHYSRPKDSPLFVIDGSLTKDQTLFLNLKPIDVFRVQVINDANKLTQFGTLGKNGIVLIETKKKSSDKIKDVRKTISVLGLNPKINKNSQSLVGVRMPDLRTNMLWIPIMETSPLGEASVGVSTGDLKGTFVVKIIGKTRNGIPFESSEMMVIK